MTEKGESGEKRRTRLCRCDCVCPSRACRLSRHAQTEEGYLPSSVFLYYSHCLYFNSRKTMKLVGNRYCDFPSEHWTRIRTNNVIERLNREIRRRTRVVGSFPDGNSALMLVCARLRHVAGTQWGNKKYMNMKHLEAALVDAFIAG